MAAVAVLRGGWEPESRPERRRSTVCAVPLSPRAAAELGTQDGGRATRGVNWGAYPQPLLKGDASVSSSLLTAVIRRGCGK